MARELEAKFAVESLAAMRRALEGAASLRKPPRFEANIVFDTPEGRLRSRGELLRLRRCGEAFTLTWKKPVAGAPAGVKAMEEVETRVADFEAMRAILSGLGYVERLRYEKVREVWTLPDAEVCLDLLPFGEFVEIEGTPETIASTAALLQLSMDDASAKTYHDIFQDHLAARGLPPADSFLFSPEQREALRARGLPD
ncbi:hypothetical protein NNJEOMEG_02163 [Fundidesulfovibrio magnetotacticus]|uniref:CYTH domain-containing protein n=1 Tax=Fundidesulfovibrio magnetotacticus TaxID=2730080 RepID=A0A6V8LTQ8_9BACT|nr:class IV adenylate cyclase [Fundidesulfovibrio magnetotacticus]GFK94320.1 hypothetical protein NNJEOMEG_02163 [Fundidesulfovibrio magnetotacticus]